MLTGLFNKLEYRCRDCSSEGHTGTGYIREVLTQGCTVVLRGACHRCRRPQGTRVLELEAKRNDAMWVKMRFELSTRPAD
jgi:hypothetical protein